MAVGNGVVGLLDFIVQISSDKARQDLEKFAVQAEKTGKFGAGSELVAALRELSRCVRSR